MRTPDTREGAEKPSSRPPNKRIPAAAAVVLVLAASAFLPLGHVLRYATVNPSATVSFAVWLLPVVLALVLAHEALIRGYFYRLLRRNLPTGFAAPAVAAVSAAIAVYARLSLLDPPRGPYSLVVSQALFVEFALGLALTLLALASSYLYSAAALFALWALRLFLEVRFRGGTLPMLELLAALLALGAVVLVLEKPLAPHREALAEALEPS